MKKTKLALFQSVVSLLLCISMLAGTTFAWFTDSVTSANNIIKSGKLDVEMFWADGTQDPNTVTWTDASTGAIFDYSLWEPGYTQVRHIKIENKGNLALKYQLHIQANGTVSKLADVIDVYFLDPAVQVSARTELTEDMKVGTLTQVLAGMPGNASGSLLADETDTVTIALKMQETAGNEYQNLSIGSDFSVILLATQEQYESDSFGTDYDKDATFDFPANTISVNVSGDVSVENGAVKEGTTLDGGSARALIPAGVQMAEGNSKLTLTISEMAKSGANLTLRENEAMRPLNVHVEGIAANNTIPMEITIKEAMPKGLNMGNYKFYHVENGNTVEMTMVDTFTAHNQFKYDPATGDIILYMATFSEVALVADTENKWNGTVATAFAGGTGAEADPYLIANADQLAYLNKLVSGANDYEKDSFEGKIVKLISNINLGGTEDNNDDHLWYPIGYWKEGNTVARTASNAPVADYIIEENTKTPSSSIADGDNTSWYTYGGAFKGVFDGAGHTISNIYQNTWELKGDYDGHYWNDAMGLFGYVYGGTIKNLTVHNFQSDGEFTPTGVIAAYAVNSTFENIAITNCNPRVYNTGNGGIVGIGGNSDDPDTYKLTFTNITIDNSNKISALWGSWDVACGGLVGMFRGAGHVYMTNCHVAAQIDVFNDVCGNYQYYWYRYAGMMVGTNKNMVTDANGYTVPETSKFHAENCTVHFGKWNDYYYCELVANSLASYTHDHQFSRLEQIQNVFEIQDESGSWKRTGNFILMNGKTPTDTCYHIVKDANGKLYEHKHADAGEEIVGGKTVLKENNQRIYLPFNQLFTGYGWGVKHIPVYNGEDYAFNGITILDREVADSKVKFDKADIAKEAYQTETTVTIGELFKAGKIDDEKLSIKSEQVQVTVSPVGENSTAGGIYTADTKDWTRGSLTFSGTGEATITITDYYFCTPTTITVNVTDREPAEKFESKFTGDFLYRVGNAKDSTVALGTLFEGENVIGNVSVSIEAVNGTSASGTYTSNATWQNGTIQFNGTGVVKVTIKDDDTYCTPTVLNLEVVDAVNATSATSAKSNNVVLLNDCGFSSLEVSGGYTLYGNGFTMTCGSDSYAIDRTYSFVELKGGTLDNVRIVAPNFSHAIMYEKNKTEGGNPSNTDSSGRTRYYNIRSAVLVSGTSKITNSYISGGRAAVYATSGTLTVENSTIYGGAVANIQAEASSNLVLDDVTLIQKPIKANVNDTSKTLMGLSVVTMCDTTGVGADIELRGYLHQYAWANKDYRQYVPSDAQDVVDEVLAKTNFVHSITYDDGVTRDSVNLGFVNMPDATNATLNNNITDNRTDKKPYVWTKVKVIAYIYTYENTNGTDGAVGNAPSTDGAIQGTVLPTVQYSDVNEARVFSTSYDSNKAQWKATLKVDVDAGAYDFSFDKLLVQKYGKNLEYTVKAADGTAVDKSKAVNLNSATEYKYILTITDDQIYDQSGKLTGKTETVTYVFELLATKTSLPAPEWISTTLNGTPYIVVDSKGGDWNCAVPVLDGLKVKYWSKKQNKEIELDFANVVSAAGLIAGLQNGSNNTIAITVTDEYTLQITTTGFKTNDNGKPVVVNGRLYFTVSSSSNYVSTGTTSRTPNISYVFTDANNSDPIKLSTSFNVVYATYKGSQYKYSDFCKGTLTAASSCVTGDTLVTLADGTQKRIDQVNYTDRLLAWDFFKGELTAVSPAIIFDHGIDNNTVIELKFSDGTTVKAVNLHQFFDADLNQFVSIDADSVADYVGHKFAKKSGSGYKMVTLVDYNVSQQLVEAWGIISSEHYNIFVEGMFSTDFMREDYDLFNYFEVGNNMTFDTKKMQSDIEKYGLYTYADFAEHLTFEQFKAFNVPYFKIAVGKGNYTYEGILALIEQYLSN